MAGPVEIKNAPAAGAGRVGVISGPLRPALVPVAGAGEVLFNVAAGAAQGQGRGVGGAGLLLFPFGRLQGVEVGGQPGRTVLQGQFQPEAGLDQVVLFQAEPGPVALAVYLAALGRLQQPVVGQLLIFGHPQALAVAVGQLALGWPRAAACW